MYCPRCGASQADDLKFCKSCGANLYGIRQAVETRDPEEKLDWSKTWVAEMFMSSDEAMRRKAEMERRQGLTPEVKRLREVKAGVITGSLGVGLSIFLFVFMEGLIRSGNITPGAAEIISRLWIAGVIPIVIGIALIINGIVVSKRIADITSQPELGPLEPNPQLNALRSPDTTEFIQPRISVTEGTTHHLDSSRQK